MFSIKDTGQAAINFQNKKNKSFKKLGNLNVLMLGKEHGRPRPRDKGVVSFLYFLHWEQIIINRSNDNWIFLLFFPLLICLSQLTDNFSQEKTARKFSCHLAMYFIVTRDFWKSIFASSLFSRRACQSKNKDNKRWINIIICVYLI